MPSVCDCPYCGQRTGIPENVDPEAVVRCPWCEYEFTLDRALMNAVEAPPEHIAEFPPGLIPVSSAAAREPEPPAAEVGPKTDAPPAEGDGTAPDTAVVPDEPAADAAVVDVLAAPAETAVVDALAAPAETVAAEPLASPVEAAVVDVLGAPAEAAVVDALAGPAETAVAEPLAAPVEAAVVDVLAAPVEAPLPAGETAVVSETWETLGGEEAAEPAVEETEARGEAAHEPYDLGLKEPGGDGAEEATFAAPLWRQQRKAHPIRNLIGLVVSGMLGLAVAYFLLNWLGPNKLKFWNRSRPQATEGENSNSAAKPSRSGAESAGPPKLPEIGSKDEFSGLEDRTFEAPKRTFEASKDVKPARPTKSTTGSGKKSGAVGPGMF